MKAKYSPQAQSSEEPLSSELSVVCRAWPRKTSYTRSKHWCRPQNESKRSWLPIYRLKHSLLQSIHIDYILSVLSSKLMSQDNLFISFRPKCYGVTYLNDTLLASPFSKLFPRAFRRAQ